MRAGSHSVRRASWLIIVLLGLAACSNSTAEFTPSPGPTPRVAITTGPQNNQTTANPVPPAATLVVAPTVEGASSPGSITTDTELALLEPNGDVVLLRGNERQKITNVDTCGDQACDPPVWSPDGYRLALNDGVWTFGAPGAAPINTPVEGGPFRWSPDGSTLAWLLPIPPGKDENGEYVGDDAVGVVVGGPDGADGHLINVRGSILAPMTLEWAPDGSLDQIPVSNPAPAGFYRDPNSTWTADGKRHARVLAAEEDTAIRLSVALATSDATTELSALSLPKIGEDYVSFSAFVIEPPQPRWLPDEQALLVPINQPNLRDAVGTWRIRLDGTITKFSPHVLTDLALDGQRFLARTADNQIVIVRTSDGSVEQTIGPGLAAAWRPTPRGSAPDAPLAARSPRLVLTSPRAEGSAVQELQTLLGTVGFPVDTVDGIFGPQTEEKVRAFQQQRELVVDGIVGPATWGALRTEAILQKGMPSGE